MVTLRKDGNVSSPLGFQAPQFLCGLYITSSLSITLHFSSFIIFHYNSRYYNQLLIKVHIITKKLDSQTELPQVQINIVFIGFNNLPEIQYSIPTRRPINMGGNGVIRKRDGNITFADEQTSLLRGRERRGGCVDRDREDDDDDDTLMSVQSGGEEDINDDEDNEDKANQRVGNSRAILISISVLGLIFLEGAFRSLIFPKRDDERLRSGLKYGVY